MPVESENSNILEFLANAGHDELIFALINGTTEISRIRGISAAGANPEITMLTPTLDSEIVASGRCLSLDVPPMTPEGIPTPALITSSVLSRLSIPRLIVDAGFSVMPKVPFFHTALGTSMNPARERALPNYEGAFSAGRYIANTLFKHYRIVALGESVPGGTTTSYLMLRALGMNVQTSSSLPTDPSGMKEDLWAAVNSRINVNDLSLEEKISEVGDYTMAATLGIISGMAGRKVLLFGGTQMATIFRLSELLGHQADLYLCTTGWVYDHRKDTIDRLIGDRRKLIVSRMSFRNSRHEGLRKYDEGHVREGAGMGGSFMLGSLKLEEGDLYRGIDSLYGIFL